MSARLTTVVTAVALTGIVWLAFFRFSGEFGLYEDDYALVTPPLEWSAAELADGASRHFRHAGAMHGRPLHIPLILTLSYLGNAVGGLQGIYALGWAVVTLNAILFYLLVRRVTGSSAAAAAGALGFVLFPADTTRAYLTHALGVQPSLTALIAALHLYVSGRRIWSFAAASLCLFLYEVPYLLFLAAPLLRWPWGRGFPRRLMVHAVLVAAMLAAAVGWRAWSAEQRVAGLNWSSAVVHAARNTSIGPWVAWRETVSRCVDGLWRQSAAYPWEVAVAWLLGAAALYWSARTAPRAPGGRKGGDPSANQCAEPAGMKKRERVWLAAAGVALLALAYPLTLTLEATETAGRATRVHIAAPVGAGIIAGCLFGPLVARPRPGLRRLLAACGVSLLLVAGAAGAGLRVQADYREAWQYQRAFWTDVLRLCPDAGAETVIVVDYQNIKGPREASVMGWHILLGLKSLYRLPSEWDPPPVLSNLVWDWRQRFSEGRPLAEYVDWKGFGSEVSGPYRAANYIWLDVEGGRLRRREGEQTIAGRTFRFLLRGEPVLPDLPRRPLYDYLILRPGETGAAYAW